MTAIIVGLGGKATVTDRGKSVKSFITDGKKSVENIVCFFRERE